MCLRVVALPAQAHKIIKRTLTALTSEHDMMDIAPVFAANYAAVAVSLNRLPLRFAEQFAILLSVLIHVVNALSMLQPLLSL